ncbi:MAG: type II toxin-antitoxin system RelE/ParE family toxin [Cytophagia bacterium]|nr:type II toxin-antitoxin system RelE/ParE family toxin [Cytophagia bacterium]
MKVKVFWTDSALADLDNVLDFLIDIKHPNAKQVVLKILNRTRQLQEFPDSGVLITSKVSSRNYRQIIEEHYKIIYSIAGTNLYVEAVFDSRQNPEKLKL